MDIRRYENSRVICFKYTPEYIGCQGALGHISRIIPELFWKYFLIIWEYSLDKVEIQTYIITGSLNCDHIKIFFILPAKIISKLMYETCDEKTLQFHISM